MLTIEVEFLMGRVTLSQWEDRTQAEWPPHPQRLFSALVAAHGELDGGEAFERALRWLERLPAPEIKVDLLPSLRTSPSYFVPVNDEAVKAEKGRSDFRHVLDRRNRQERFFPTVVPNDPVVTFQWPVASGFEDHRDALSGLVENITYLGHSSSPVRACLRAQAVLPTLCPDEEGSFSLRVPGAGRFDRLVSVHSLREEDESVQPPLGRFQSYEPPDVVTPNVFSRDAIVVAFAGGPRLGLDSTLPLMQHMRNAVLAKLGPSPEVLSGHDDKGNMSRKPHLSIVPLPFVNSRHSDGSLKGAAFVLPSDADEPIRHRLSAALTQTWQLHLGPLGSIAVAHVDWESNDGLKSLNFSKYTQVADTWATVTPVVFDRYPKSKGPTAAEIIAAACERIGLPKPLEVMISAVSAISGVPRANEFHGRSKQVDNRLRQHAVIRFERGIKGPVILGAGRFCGLGLFMPLGKSKP
ncbi:type I-G CRISPR-associated protein Csb2 [Povalibacter sp.]|uniref:type I-G CRISPR-associated protein Csb2 n=1 Tax=Povalibacter sp. TaxID=1962978 RepID=UPI002F3E75DC